MMRAYNGIDIGFHFTEKMRLMLIFNSAIFRVPVQVDPEIYSESNVLQTLYSSLEEKDGMIGLPNAGIVSRSAVILIVNWLSLGADSTTHFQACAEDSPASKPFWRLNVLLNGVVAA